MISLHCESNCLFCCPEHFGSLQRQHTDALQTSQEQKTLIAQLESDLSRVQPYLPVRGEGEGMASPSSAEIMSEVLRDVEQESVKVKPAADVAGGANSLLPIVSSQRERFKQRNIELEAVSRFLQSWKEEGPFV